MRRLITLAPLSNCIPAMPAGIPDLCIMAHGEPYVSLRSVLGLPSFKSKLNESGRCRLLVNIFGLSHKGR